MKLEQFFDFFFFWFMSDNADKTVSRRGSGSDINLTRSVVKVDPAAVFVFNDALGAYDEAVLFAVIKSKQHCLELVLGISARGLVAD